MENTLENAIDFADEFVGSNVQLGYKPTTKIPEMLVAYAASVRPEVVVPSEEEIGAESNKANGYQGHDSIPNGKHVAFNYGFFLGAKWAIKRLNTDMTFTELNHNEK